MLTLPDAIVPIFAPFATLFTNPTWQKAQLLMVGAVLTTGQRTVAAGLRVMGRSDQDDYSRYHEVLNRAVWSPREAARILLALLLQAAAVIAGSDPAKMDRLPDSTGMKNEIIIHKSHRFPYDQCYTSVGAKFVEIGDGRRCQPWQLEAAFTENTAAVAYLFSPFITRRAIPFPEVCEIAHRHGVPVIVDAASMLPPRANLRRFTAEGADMVIYSGGKGVRGPQGTGILCGREDLIDAAFANAAPHQFIGRGMKVAKEEIVGLLQAIRIFVDEDEDAEMARYRSMTQQVVDALSEVPGLGVSLEQDEHNYLIPHAVMRFTREWQGPGRNEVYAAMVAGDPPIYLHDIFDPDELAVDPFNLDEDELEIVIHRLSEVLLG